MILIVMMVLLFYIHGSVHHNSMLIRPNKMQHYAGICLVSAKQEINQTKDKGRERKINHK